MYVYIYYMTMVNTTQNKYYTYCDILAKKIILRYSNIDILIHILNNFLHFNLN